VSERPTPDCLTSVRGSLQLLPTPTRWVQGEVDLDKYLARREREKAKGRNGNGFGMPLDMAIRFLPTPMAHEDQLPNHPSHLSYRLKAAEAQASGRTPPPSTGGGTTLGDPSPPR